MSIERNSFINKPGDATVSQRTITARYKKNVNTGVELITFTHRGLGMELVFICNIPQDLVAEEDRVASDRSSNEAPVYVKFKIEKPGPDTGRELVNDEEDPTESQITLTGRLKDSRGGHEVFTFVLRMGMAEIVYIVNIPQCLYSEDDRVESTRPADEAPVYAKTKISLPRFDGPRPERAPAEHHEHAATAAPVASRVHTAKEPPPPRAERHDH